MTGSTTTPRPTRVSQRGDYDCMRAALASLLGLTLDETPDAGPGNGTMLAAWEAWAPQRGLAMHVHEKDDLPTDHEFWVAGVRVLVTEGMRAHALGPAEFHGHNYHAVVMSYGELWHDPVTWLRRGNDPCHQTDRPGSGQHVASDLRLPVDAPSRHSRRAGGGVAHRSERGLRSPYPRVRQLRRVSLELRAESRRRDRQLDQQTRLVHGRQTGGPTGVQHL